MEKILVFCYNVINSDSVRKNAHGQRRKKAMEVKNK